MPVTPIIASELFEGLIECANAIEAGKKPSSEPTDFCDNFYAQFFQNRMKQEISGFGNDDKEAAVKLRLKAQATEGTEVILLIASFERYCELRYDIFAEQYGGGDGEALTEFCEYLDILLQRITGWAGVEKLQETGSESEKARLALQKAMRFALLVFS